MHVGTMEGKLDGTLNVWKWCQLSDSCDWEWLVCLPWPEDRRDLRLQYRQSRSARGTHVTHVTKSVTKAMMDSFDQTMV